MSNHLRREEGSVPAPLPIEAPVWAVAAAVAIVVAAWIAAGSIGLLADPLRRTLTWVALLVAVGAGAPRPGSGRQKGLVLAAAVLAGLLMTAVPQSEAHILAVALVGAALAWTHRDLPRRIVSLAAVAVVVLAIFRIAVGAVPTFWLVANGCTGVLGRLVGDLVGRPLDIGLTYGGLDFLVVMVALYAGWLCSTPSPRLRRSLIVAVAIAAGHFTYLSLLAHTETLRAMLPDVVMPPEGDRDILGIWTWGNAAHRLLPWNMPLLAAMIHGVFLTLMFRWTAWLPVVDPKPEPDEKEKRKRDEQLTGSALVADMALDFGPLVLAMLLPLVGWLAPGTSDLKGKTIVAYEEGYLDWLRPTHEDLGVQTDGSFGMLPVLVESLGGAWVRSAELSSDDLAGADVVLVAHPDQPWQAGQLERLADYVRGGGSLLVAAEPRIAQRGSASSFDEALQPTAIRVNDDTAIGHQANWQDSFEAFSHPAAVGATDTLGGFGFRDGSSLQAGWPARPVLVGRYGYATPGSDAVLTSVFRYEAGDRLGDLVLAAEQRFGGGRVFVLGDTSPLANQMLVESYGFTGRLLGYLAAHGGTPQSPWRQLLSFLTAGGLIALLVWRPAPAQVALCAIAMAATLACVVATSHWSSRVLPDGREHKPRNNIAYIDGTHAEFYGRESSLPEGLGTFHRTLMRNDYLPLRLSDFTEERLERAGLLVAIAPARPYSGAEIAMVERFVARGGHFVCMVGAEESRSIRPLLKKFGFDILPSPVHPEEDLAEPIPLSSFRQLYYEEGELGARVQFWNGWPVTREELDSDVLVKWSDGTLEFDVVASRRVGSGTVTVIGDSYFAQNRNFASPSRPWENDHYWRWLLARLAGPKPWHPTPSESADDPDDGDEDAVQPDARNTGEGALAEPGLIEPDAGMIEPSRGMIEPDKGMIEPEMSLREPNREDDAFPEGMSPEDDMAPEDGGTPQLDPPARLDELKVPDRFRRITPPDSESLSTP